MIFRCLVISVIVFISCNNDKQFQYANDRLSVAWQSGDTTYVKDWIKNLDKLDFKTFANVVSDFQNESNFYYGGIDLEGDLSQPMEQNATRIIQEERI